MPGSQWTLTDGKTGGRDYFTLQSRRVKSLTAAKIVGLGGALRRGSGPTRRIILHRGSAPVPAAPGWVGRPRKPKAQVPSRIRSPGWAIRADPSGTSFNVVGEQIGSPAVPCDIPAGAEEIFFMYLNAATNLKSGADRIEGTPQQILATVLSGGRTYVSKPIAPENLAIESRGAQ